jgi:Tfp pilus assembly protein PilN
MVQLCFTGGKFALERACVREIPKDDLSVEGKIADIKALISSMIAEENFDISVKVTLTAPSEKVFFQSFRTDLSINEDIQRLVKYELEDDFPIPFDELVAGICGSRGLNGNYKEYLVGAINRIDLQERIDTLKQAHLKCSAVTADVCALNAIASASCNLKDDGPTIIIHTDDSRIILVISEKGKLVCARHFDYQNSFETNSDKPLTSVQIIIREVEMTLRSMYGLYNGSKLKVLITGRNELLGNLSKKLSDAIDYELVAFNPFAKISCSKQQQSDANIVIAMGLALIGTNEVSEELNFNAIDELRSGKTEKTKRGLLVTGALILLIGILLLGKLFYELNDLENQHELVKKQIRMLFVDTLPEEKRIVNELAQMSEQLDIVQEEYNILTAGLNDRILPLKILQVISEKITPDQSVRINDISMDPGSVELLGVAASFESVDNLVGVLRNVSAFKGIEVPNIDVDSQGSGVRFTLLIKTELK